MTHPVFVTQLDAYLDGELAAPEAGELEAHLRVCPDCSRLERRRRTLSVALREQLPRYEAPDTLRARVRAALREQSSHAARRRTVPWRALSVAASLVVVAVGSWQLATRNAGSEAIADQVLASHVRSLMAGHLADVPSSDQHTVKPWFNGKLDFSPPVFDFAGRGFPLLGGRLDYVDGQQVAALVYGRRQHVINVFLWPAGRGRAAGSGAREFTRQGYHVLHWTTPEYTYWVASDLGLPELRDFLVLVQRGDAATR
ncbi:MAG TPA: anti-sigma factor [Gemmatimonadales bacterium]|nr:anti-sigma factor [Gemmatimonadales bacterium]